MSRDRTNAHAAERAGNCGLIAPELCPACAAIEQCEFVRGRFGDWDDLPLFPDASGRFVSKAGMKGSIVEAARELGLPTVGHGDQNRMRSHLPPGGSRALPADPRPPPIAP